MKQTRELVLVTPRNDRVAQIIAEWSQFLSGQLDGTPHKRLDSRQATRARLSSSVKDDAAILFFGHGKENALLGYAGKAMLDLNNVGSVKGCVVLAVACRSLKQLGPAAVNAGARVYIGFNDDLMFLLPTSARDHAELFGNAATAGARALISGHSATRALDATRDAFEELVTYFKYGGGKKHANALWGFLAANWNSRHAGLVGDANATLLLTMRHG